MQTIVQNLAFGLFVGGIYGVAAAGLALVFGVLKILNVAHGELLMFGGYISFWLFSLLGLDPFVSLLITMLSLFVIGIVLDRLVFRYLTHLHGETRIKNSLLVSFGLTLILQNAALASFTADERTIQLSYSAAGIAIGAALAGMAGSLVVIGYGIAPDIGLSWTLKALVVITLAGTGSVLGAFPAGLLLGLVEAISGMAFGSIYRETAGLALACRGGGARAGSRCGAAGRSR